MQPKLERLHTLAKALVDARRRFGNFETHFGDLGTADQALSGFLLHEMQAPDFLAVTEVCNRAVAYDNARNEMERAATDGNSDDRHVATCRVIQHEAALRAAVAQLIVLDAQEPPDADA